MELREVLEKSWWDLLVQSIGSERRMDQGGLLGFGPSIYFVGNLGLCPLLHSMFQERTTSSCTGCVTLSEEPGWAVGLVELERHVDHFLNPFGVVLSVYQWWVTWHLLLQLSCNYAPGSSAPIL